MDAITDFIFNLNNELLTKISLILNNDIFFALLVIALVLIAEKRDPKRVKIFSALLLATILAIVIKSFTAVERPCASMDLYYCPEDYSFPSLHALVSFTLMISFLNKKSYPFFVLFALFVSFTRMALAVHTFRDVAGALSLALVVYYVIDVLWRRFSDEKTGA